MNGSKQLTGMVIKNIQTLNRVKTSNNRMARLKVGRDLKYGLLSLTVWCLRFIQGSPKEIAIDIDDYIYGITNGSGSYRSTSPTTIGIQDNVLQENHLAIVNYPNPFTGRTTIHYSVPEKSFITLKVLNVNGNEIESLVYTQMDKGNFTIDFETGNLPAGIYFYVLSDGTSIASGKMSIVN